MEFNKNSPFFPGSPSHLQKDNVSENLPLSPENPEAGAALGMQGEAIPRSLEPNQKAYIFDVFSWYPSYQSSLRYFLEKAQFQYACQALAAFLNIKLPYQRLPPAEYKKYQLVSAKIRPEAVNAHLFRNEGSDNQASSVQPGQTQPGGLRLQPVDYLSFGHVSLLPYIRRLVVTGYDRDGVLRGWFGDNWISGLTPLLESERQNYMFAAKNSSWAMLRNCYDEVKEEAVPFLTPLQRVTEAEIVRAEEFWGKHLSMQDWMLGPRSIYDEDEMDGHISESNGLSL